MNLLQIVQQSCNEMALGAPVSVAGNQDPQTRQMLALLNRLGSDLCRQFDWQFLDREHLITTIASTKSATVAIGSPLVNMPDTAGITVNYGVDGMGVPPFSQVVEVTSLNQVRLNQVADKTGTFDLNFAQVAYPLPSDWKKQIPQTEWDRTNRWPLMGPQSPQSWQSFKSGIVYAGPRTRFRILANAIVLNPPPANNLTMSFEYISNSFALSSTGVPKNAFTADDDTSYFDDSLLITGLKAKFKQAKGLDVSYELSEYNSLLDLCKAQNKSAPTLSLAPFRGSVLLGLDNIQDGNWPGGV